MRVVDGQAMCWEKNRCASCNTWVDSCRLLVRDIMDYERELDVLKSRMCKLPKSGNCPTLKKIPGSIAGGRGGCGRKQAVGGFSLLPNRPVSWVPKFIVRISAPPANRGVIAHG